MAAVVAAGALALVGLAACSNDDGTPDADSGDCTTKALVVTNVTGAGSSNGTMNVLGVQTAVDRINDDGGILGCQIEFDVLDNGSDYTKSLPLVQEALAKEDYAMVFSGDFGGASVFPYLKREGMLSISANGTAGITDDNPYLFDTSVPNAGAAGALFEYIASEDVGTVAVIVDNTTVGESTLASFTDAANEAGVEVVGSERIDLSSINMTPVIQRVQASGAEGLVVNIFGQAAGYVVRDFRASGWDVPMYGGISLFASPLEQYVPAEDLEGVVAIGPASGTFPSTDAMESILDDIAAAGESITGNLTSMVNAHDAFTLWAWAANESGSLEPAEVAEYLEEHGDDPVPNLGHAEATNYSADNHGWYPKKGVAVAKAGTRDDQGRLEQIELLDAKLP